VPRVRPADPDSGQLTLLFGVDTGSRPPDDLRSDDPLRDHAPGAAPAPAPAAAPVVESRAPTPDPSVDPADDWRALLDFERGWSGPLTAKQRAIRDSFGLSSARYHQLLDRALELPEALEHDPALVGRLRRLREARRGKRFARRVQVTG
jgi:hypothetical protein